MTLVQLDEPALHVDTDAAGEPCVVARDARAPSNPYVASERGRAYASDPTCYTCGLRIATERESAYVFGPDRVVHTEQCLALYLVETFRFRGVPLTAVAPRPTANAVTSYFIIPVPRSLGASSRRAVQVAGLTGIAHGARHVILDCQDTAYIDASGIGCVIALQAALRQVHPSGRVYVAGACETVRHLLALTRVDTIVTLVDTVAEAEVRACAE